jgi:hypothetical protein
MNQDTQAFETNWKRFETTVKGKLLEKQKQQDVAVGFANIILKEAATNWFSSYSAEGRWLSRYTENNPDKGSAVKAVLKNDMKFVEVAAKQTISPYVKYGVAVAGAVVGGGLAGLFTESLLPRIIGAAVPAAVLYPMASEYEKSALEGGKSEAINGYIAQLEQYKQSIIRIIG